MTNWTGIQNAVFLLYSLFVCLQKYNSVLHSESEKKQNSTVENIGITNHQQRTKICHTLLTLGL